MKYISIIIPVYNVEVYIRGTLDSIYNQKVDDHLFEVIIVNDGTPDNSMDIVQEFAILHSNITIINQINQGLSCARNSGMRVANGDFIWVVDSDDLVTDYSLKEIIEVIQKHSDIDMFCFDLYEKRGEHLEPTSLFLKSSYRKYYGKIYDGYFFCRKLPIGISQRFLYRRSFLEENGLKFTPGIYHEDMDFLIRCYTKAQRVMPLNRIWYIYNIRENGSITSTFKIKRFHDLMWIIGNFRKMSNLTDSFKDRTLLEEGVFTLSYGLLNSTYCNIEEFKIFLKDNSAVLKQLLISSYFKSFRKNSLGKTWRLLKSII